ncbi:MAG TPA: phosphatase PAP2 family protein [Gallionella sp.]|nr:phosphatase PAP2 family protein [Gallionella sp.]
MGDVKHVLTAPTRWQDQEWQNLGLAAVGVIGVAAIIDRPVRDEMRRHAPNNNRFMLKVERFGAEYSIGVLGGFYLAGVIGNETAADVARDGLAASIIASGMITPTLKFITGRARPRENAGIAKFHPFSIGYSPNSSFPSGHTTQAFALASVIANHYEETWVTCASYSVAGLVGVARSYHDAHFASDVLSGALIGTLVGKSVVAHNKPQHARNVVVLPEIAPGSVGVRLTGSF